MRPARLRADQDVLPQVKIILEVGEAATLHPSPVGGYREPSPPTVLTPSIEDDGYLRAVTERMLQCAVQF
jgi:hypothetical protein